MRTATPIDGRAPRAWRPTSQFWGWIAILALAHIGPLQAAATVEVLETYPAGEEVTLGRNETFYLRLAYDSDKPIGIWARPYYRGQPANAGNNGSYSYTGKGEALGWFFFSGNHGEVDEVRITAGDGSIASWCSAWADSCCLCAHCCAGVGAGAWPPRCRRHSWVSSCCV